MTQHQDPRPAFEISLVGYWVAFDPANPATGVEAAALNAEMSRIGLTSPSLPEGAEVLLAASMTDAAEDRDVLELILASLVVIQHRGTVKTKLSPDGGIVPQRRVRRRTFEWPGGDVGKVTFHEVTYTIPYPDAPTYVTLTFTTPNLTRIDEMEWVFDTIAGTSAWVDPTS